MEIRIRNAAGALMLVSGLPAIAQNSALVRASTVANCASCPPREDVHVYLTVEGGPTFLVASLTLILGGIVGAFAGYAIGRSSHRRERPIERTR